jgi:hypothetical protein
MNDSLAEANDIVREWQGYSADILYYCGSPGIGGGIQILFSSPHKDRYFLVQCGACRNKFKNTFQCEIDRLKIEIDPDLKMIHFFDIASRFNIVADRLIIDELLNTDAVLEIESQLFDRRKSTKSYYSIDGVYFFNRFIDREFVNGKVMVNEFSAFTNALEIGLYFDVTKIFGRKKATSTEYTKVVLNNPSYIYSDGNPQISIEDIRVFKGDKTAVILSADFNKNLYIECDSIQIVNYWSYESYKYSIETNSGWHTAGNVESLFERYRKLHQQRLLCIQAKII